MVGSKSPYLIKLTDLFYLIYNVILENIYRLLKICYT